MERERRWFDGAGGGVVVLALVLLAFAVVGQAIIQVKLLELRMQVSRDRLFNYELSSRVLKARFRSMIGSGAAREDFRTEVERNVLETRILNEANPEEPEDGPIVNFGTAVINSVRLLSLRPLLALRQGQNLLVRLKYAFYLERNRRYDAAAERYTELSRDLGDSRDDTAGFVRLHLGFCEAVAGRREQALATLKRVEADFPATHYAQTAALLIEILRENERRKAEIAAGEESPLDRARKFYRAKLYREAIESYRLMETAEIPPFDEYRLSRSYEEAGRVEIAVKGYVAIVEKNADVAAVREATRRLLLLGTFHGVGADIREFAEESAERQGDDAVLQEIRTADQEVKAAVVVEEIREIQSRAQESAAGDDGLALLAREFEAEEFREIPLKEVLPEVVPEEAPQPEPKKEEPRIRLQGVLQVELVDGRRMQADSADFTADGYVDLRGRFPVRVPASVIRSIRAAWDGPVPASRAPRAQLSVRRSDGQRVSGTMVRMSETGVVISGGDDVNLNLADLRAIEVSKKTVEIAPERGR